MTKVLFITANPNSAEGSFGMAVGKHSSKLIKRTSTRRSCNN